MARLAILYTQRLIWGFDCEVDTILNRMRVLRNEIAIITHYADCKVAAKLLHTIKTDIRKLQDKPLAGFCKNCN